MYDLNIFNNLNRLFCTFTTNEELDEVLASINRRYTILYNKIFILESPQSKELVCTYNIDMGNMSSSPMPNTILMHRKKDYNCLYTINALNNLIRSLNNGQLNNNYQVDWKNYKNCILLSESNSYKKLDTKIYKIFSLN